MDVGAPFEDERGVEVGQIREQLTLSVPERVRSMVETANVLLELQHHAAAARHQREL